MGDLRKQLKQAGLISGKQEMKLAREARQREHDQDKAERAGDAEKVRALEGEAGERRRELAAQQEAERQAERERVEAVRAARAQRELEQRIHALIDSNKVKPGRGEQDWHFVATDGGLERMGVSDDVAEGLRQAELVIIERPPKGAPEGAFPFEILPAEAALRLEELAPLAVRFFSVPDRLGGPKLAAREAASGTESAAPTDDGEDFLAGLE